MKDPVKHKLIYQRIIIGFLILTIVPFIILHFFNQPTPEDFYYSEEARNIGLLNSLRVLYKFYGGRYFTYILISLQPLYYHSIILYKIVTLLFMMIFIYVLYYFISEFTKNFLSKNERIVLSLSVFFVYLISMPSSGQGIYWLISVMHYNSALILMMLFSVFYHRIQISENVKARGMYIFLSCLTAALIPGTIELAAVIMLLYISILIISSIISNKKINWWLVLISVITVICVYFVFASPGNAERSIRYPENHMIWQSVYLSLTFLLESVVLWIFTTPLLIVTILLLPLFFKLLKKYPLHGGLLRVKIIYLILIFGVFTYSSTFVIAWSIGIMPYDRILNFIFFIFLIGWFWIISSLISQFTIKYKITNFRIPKIIYVISGTLMLFFLIRENNVTTACSDLVTGKAKQFNQTMYDRYDQILSSIKDSLELDSIPNIPKSFFLQDITSNSQKPFNKGYQSYFKKKFIVIKK